ncbi:hypothetical protein ABN034_22450 [Actinopolymorpha sp. B11F2]|uniref:hypothetical protein n=1 Tax=Actinopolymorpha sp. B11F2 TaxID=3160862 RepID=UPI0032E4592F
MSLAVVRTEAISVVGEFAVAFSIYVLVTGLARAIVTDGVLAAQSSNEPFRQGSGRACAIGVAVAPAVVIVGSCVGSPYITITGVMLPGLVLYDYNKMISLGVGRAGTALAEAIIWVGVTAIAVLLCLFLSVSPCALFTVWAGSGAALGLVGARLRRCRILPAWGLRHAETKVCASFGLLFMFTSGAVQLATTALAVTVGAGVVGALAAARTVLAPVTLLQVAASSLVIPYLARRKAASKRVRLQASLRVTGLATGLILPLALILPMLPDSVGTALLAANWQIAQPLLAALAVESMLAMAARVGLDGHRIQQAGRRALLIGALIGGAYVVLVVAGGLAFQAYGAAYAMVVVALFGSALCWWSYVSLLSEDPPVSRSLPGEQASVRFTVAPTDQ